MKIKIIIEAEGTRPVHLIGNDDPARLVDALWEFLDKRAGGHSRPKLHRDERIADYQLQYLWQIRAERISDVDSPQAKTIFDQLWRQYKAERETELGEPLIIRNGKNSGVREYNRLYKALRIRTKLALKGRWRQID